MAQATAQDHAPIFSYCSTQYSANAEATVVDSSYPLRKSGLPVCTFAVDHSHLPTRFSSAFDHDHADHAQTTLLLSSSQLDGDGDDDAMHQQQ
ncbi:hypothetical protein D3C80_1952620 [compost metagenome]